MTTVFIKQQKEKMDDEFRCDFCNKEQDMLYEGWFRTEAARNPFAVGTASAGLLQIGRSCRSCLKKAIATGMTPATEIPDEE